MLNSHITCFIWCIIFLLFLFVRVSLSYLAVLYSLVHQEVQTVCCVLLILHLATVLLNMPSLSMGHLHSAFTGMQSACKQCS